MEHINNNILIYTYKKAVELELAEEFLDLLKNELYMRGIRISGKEAVRLNILLILE